MHSIANVARDSGNLFARRAKEARTIWVKMAQPKKKEEKRNIEKYFMSQTFTGRVRPGLGITCQD